MVQFECGTRILRVISRAGSLCRVDKVMCQFHSQVCPLSAENA